jgi:NAD(P)-dependent dehydrogenase (short-subunit alcohol dehydrogenase family)
MARNAETYDVRGRTVLITGAARGIGWEAARRLYAHGANLALVGLEPELLEQRAGELGDRAAAFPADVTDWDTLGAAVDGAVARFGGIDVAIANAGISAVGSVMGSDIGAFERTIEVNLMGVWRTNRLVLPHVVARSGYVLNVASLAAITHAPLMAAYAASKAGVEAFTDCLRQEVAVTGTKVGVAYFGFIDTDLVRDSFDNPAAAKLREGQEKSPIFKPIPVSRAADAIETGIHTRAKRVQAPNWIVPMRGARGLINALPDKLAGSPEDVAEAVRLADTTDHHTAKIADKYQRQA